MLLFKLLLMFQLTILHPVSLSHYGPRETVHSYIVLHSTESCSSPESVISYLRKTGKSYHFLIERDGTIVQLVDPYYQAKHAGWSIYHGLLHFNRFSIGISFMQCKNQIYTSAQYKSGKLLIDMLMHKYSDITASRIVTHHQISLFRGKRDPANFDFNQLNLEKPVPVPTIINKEVTTHKKRVRTTQIKKIHHKGVKK